MANGNFGGGNGTELNPYLIEDAQDLNAVRNNLSAHYKQTNNIDLLGIDFIPLGQTVPYDYDLSVEFTGLYDGDNFKISNLNIISEDVDEVGLFSILNNANLKNVILVTPNTYGYYNVGSLAGAIYDGAASTIENCHAIGGIVTAEYEAGGLIGSDYSSGGTQIISCSTTCDVNSNRGVSAGLAGWCGYNSVTKKCYTKGTIKGEAECGGLFALTQENARIENCYSNSEVSWLSDSNTDAGGFIGYMLGYCEIINCYSTGKVETHHYSNTGGFIASYDDAYSIINCYFDTENSGHGNNGLGIPKTTEQMKQQSTFNNWDFENIWSIRENETYPYFATRSTGQLQAMPLTSITVVN